MAKAAAADVYGNVARYHRHGKYMWYNNGGEMAAKTEKRPIEAAAARM